MVVNALLMNLADNVVTTVTEIAKGDDVCFMKGSEHMILKAEEDIPYCHKVALEDIGRGSDVIKYGESLGHTVADISKGCWVNDHNLKSELRDYDSELAGDVAMTGKCVPSSLKATQTKPLSSSGATDAQRVVQASVTIS